LESESTKKTGGWSVCGESLCLSETYTGIEDCMHFRVHAHGLAFDIIATIVRTMVIMTGGYNLTALDEHRA
jgi:hypothetical protein